MTALIETPTDILTSLAFEEWEIEYLPYTITEGDGSERELANYRISRTDTSEDYIAETCEQLPRVIQEAHASLIAASPRMFRALLNIKRIVGKCGDEDADPSALLTLVQFEMRAALNTLAKE